MSRLGDDGRLYIDQFMWPYQQHFRIDLAILAERSFELVGLAVDPRVMLIGFAEAGEHLHQICIEPEDGLFVQDDFGNVLACGQELYDADDDRHMFVTVKVNRNASNQVHLTSPGRGPSRRLSRRRSASRIASTSLDGRNWSVPSSAVLAPTVVEDVVDPVVRNDGSSDGFRAVLPCPGLPPQLTLLANHPHSA